MNRLKSATASTLAAVVVLATLVTAANALAENGGCGAGGNQSFHGSGHDGSVSVSGECSVRFTDLPGAGGLPVLVIDCGYATASDDHTFWNKACGPTGFPCPAIPGNPSPHQFLTTTGLTGPPIPIAQWCAGINTPMPSATALRDEIIRLLHPAPIGISPDTPAPAWST